MSRRILTGTRKGLFSIEKSAGKSNDPWRIVNAHFLGDPVSQVLCDPRNGSIYVALELGHFGIKLHVSRDAGESFENVSVTRIIHDLVSSAGRFRRRTASQGLALPHSTSTILLHRRRLVRQSCSRIRRVRPRNDLMNNAGY